MSEREEFEKWFANRFGDRDGNKNYDVEFSVAKITWQACAALYQEKIAELEKNSQLEIDRMNDQVCKRDATIEELRRKLAEQYGDQRY